jgi:hypothetical protein
MGRWKERLWRGRAKKTLIEQSGKRRRLLQIVGSEERCD